MLTAILHLILGIITAAAAAAAYSAWKKSGFREIVISGLFWFFFFFTGTHIAIFTPLLLAPGNLAAAAWGHIAAMVFIFLFLFSIWRAEFDIVKTPAREARIFLALFLLAGAGVAAAQIYDFRLPILHESGFVFWNINPFLAWAASLASIMTAAAWVMIFIKKFPKNANYEEKLKLWFFIAGAAFFVLAAIAYFPSDNFPQSVAAFILLFLATILFAFPFAISKLKSLKRVDKKNDI